MGNTADDRPGAVFDDRLAGPTAPRLVLGLHLRRLRESRAISREEAGDKIRASQSEITRLELGRTGVRLRDVVDLCTLYGVTDQVERATLLGLARQSRVPGWWHSYRDVIPDWFEPYLAMEQAASIVRTYEVQFIPGLLQTPGYARAVMELDYGNSAAPQVERRLELRMRRQYILRRSAPPNLWVVIDEAALRRPIGGAATMFAQLQHLIDLCARPHITVQLMPFATDSVAGGPITLLRFPEPEVPDVVYLEQLTSALYPDNPDVVDGYQTAMDHLVTHAEPPSATPEILVRILKEL